MHHHHRRRGALECIVGVACFDVEISMHHRRRRRGASNASSPSPSVWSRTTHRTQPVDTPQQLEKQTESTD
jgi:hypothetical protein